MGLNYKINFGDIKAGDRIPGYEVKMDSETYFAYNSLINEINPLHFDESYARGLGYKDIVVAGVYTFSFIPKIITDWIGEPGMIQSIRIKYNDPVYLEDVVRYAGTVKRKYIKNRKKFLDCEITAENREGTRLIEATATVRLDGR